MVTVISELQPAMAPARPPVEPMGDQVVDWIGIGWEGYQALLKVQGERSRPRIIYLDGDAQLVTTSNIHERMTNRLGTFIREVVVGLDIPCEPTRETTFYRQDLDAGVQPDDSFYLANYRPIAAKDGQENILLDVDPPPDLVIEVQHTNPAKKAVEVLRRLGVPEVWVYTKDGLRFLVLAENGPYAESKRSLNFPFLAADEVFEWVERPGMASTTQWVKELREWVQDILVPRVRGQGG